MKWAVAVVLLTMQFKPLFMKGFAMTWGTSTGTGFVPSEEPTETAAEPEKKKASRNPRATKAQAKAAQGLVDALAFVEPSTSEEATHEEYVRFTNKWVVAFSRPLAMGHPIEEELSLCPHLKKLKTALKEAGATLAMSATDNGRLSIVGAKLRAVVPCVPGDTMPPVMPDPQCAVIDDRIKEGFKAVTALAKEDAERVHEASVLLRANTIVGCNSVLAMEYYHGIDLPPGLAIPQRAAKAIAKSSKKLTGFGFDWGRSATFYFEGGGWLKTQLFDQEWPDIDKVLNTQCYLSDVPAGLWEALNAISSFSEDGSVHFDTDKLRSTYADAPGEGNALMYGATYDVPGLQARHSFSAKLLKLAQPACAQFDYTTHPDKVVFYNNAANLRGVLMKKMG